MRNEGWGGREGGREGDRKGTEREERAAAAEKGYDTKPPSRKGG